MFSHNGKISEKQMRRMLVLSVFAGTIFVIPYLSARFFATSIGPGLLVFFLFAWIYVTCIYAIGEWYQKKTGLGSEKEAEGKEGDIRGEEGGFVAAVTEKKGAGNLLLILQSLRMLIRLVFYVVLSIAILGEAQVPFMQGKETDITANLFVVLPLLLVALYGASTDDGNEGQKKNRNMKNRIQGSCQGIEKQGRIHEIMFWVLFIPFIIVILFGLKEVDYSIFIPHLNLSYGRLIMYGYALLPFLLPVENYLYVRPALKRTKTVREKKGKNALFDKKQHTGISYLAILFVVALMLLLTLMILGIFGVRGAGQEEMVTIAIMRYIRLPFGVLQRFDVMMVWFFMTGCFLLICGTLYYEGYLLSHLCRGGKRVWLLLAVLVLVFLMASYLPAYGDTLNLFIWYGAMIDVPLSLIIPLLGMFLVKRKTGKGMKRREMHEKNTGTHHFPKEMRRVHCGKYRQTGMFILLGACLFLTGCSNAPKIKNDMKNVEERDYATLLLISEGEDKSYHFLLGIAEEKMTGERSRKEEVSEWDCDDFESLAEEYQRVKGKDLSLSHLKVILLSPEEMEESVDQSATLFNLLDQNEEIAKTCPVLALYENALFLEYLEEVEEPVGTYLESIIWTAEKQGEDIPWLKDYLKAIREGERQCIYFLKKDTQGWRIEP